jgi:ActR/RegA family two-component response regulator
MAIYTDALSKIRVLVCLADADQGTALAHALGDHGLDVLVAHHIRSAMRVMEKEAPQAVVVEVATSAYDGFRVAQWAEGRVRAIFLVASRQLTMMEDVEVLTSGAKELFYTPLQPETIAASIIAACNSEANQADDLDGAEVKTQYNPQGQLMESHAANTVRAVSIIEGSANTEAMTAVKPSDLASARDTVTDASIIPMPDADHAPTLLQGQYARRPEPDFMVPPAAPEKPDSVESGQPTGDTVDAGAPLTDDMSSSLVADLFDAPLGPTVIDPSSVPSPAMPRTERQDPDPGSLQHQTFAPSGPTAPNPTYAPEHAEPDATASLIDDLFDGRDLTSGSLAPSDAASIRSSPLSQRNIEAPPDDEFLMSEMMDGLEDLSVDSLAGPKSKVQAEREEEEEEQEEQEEAPEEATTTSSVDPNEESLPTEKSDGPATVDLIAAAYGVSSTSKRVAQGLVAAVVGASVWLGALATERLAPMSDGAPTSEADSETIAKDEARSLLHSTLGEAAINHRDGEIEAAKVSYQAALDQDKANPVAIRGLIAIAIDEADWATARRSLKELTAVQPDDPALALQRALVLSKMNQGPAASAELVRFIHATKPDDPRRRSAAQVYLSLTDKSAP